MDEDGSSEAGPRPHMSRGDIAEEDVATTAGLFQKCPHLWNAFKDIIRFVDLLTTATATNEQIQEGLIRLYNRFVASAKDDRHNEDLTNFMAVSGFVEKSVATSRKILRNMGKSYITEFQAETIGNTLKSTNVETACVFLIRTLMCCGTYHSSEFCLRLTRTGFLQDLVEDLKHIQHLSVEALERDRVFLISVGTIQNCCMMQPETIGAIKQLDIAPFLTTFLVKKPNSFLIHTISLGTLVHVLDEDQHDLLTLSPPLLQLYLSNIQAALSINQDRESYRSVKELLFELHLLARIDANKRLMVTQGILQILVSVLDLSKKRSEEEKKHAVTLIDRLIEDQINLHICQNYQELVNALECVAEEDGAKEAAEKACGILETLKNSCKKDLDDQIPAFPHLAKLLADQGNILTILNMSLVDFVMDEVQEVIRASSKPPSAPVQTSQGQVQSGLKLALSALTELTGDEGYRRELMARGGLATVRTVLERGISSQEKMQAVTAVLQLVRTPDIRPVIQIDADLTTVLEDVKQRADTKDLSELAENVLLALRQEINDH